MLREQPVSAQAPSPAMRVIEDAAAALGGMERLLAVRTLVIEGYGRNPNLGQAMTPEAEPLLWMLPDYRRSIDLENGRMELAFTRRPAFPAVFDNARQVQRLDGDVAYNVPAGGGRGGGAPNAPARLGPQAVRDRRIDMLQHPLTLLRAALDPAARVDNLRADGGRRSVDITTAQGDRLTLTVDEQNRPLSIRTAVYHQNLGDTERVTTFGGYEDLDGVRLPKRIVTTLDRWVEYDIGVMKNTLDADLTELAAPAGTRAQPMPAAAPGPPMLNVTDVAPGIWFVTGGGNPSIIVEFADHVALVEVAGNDARVEALIATANRLAPGKRVTQAIVTHHHFDHTGGLRAAVAAGLEIITHRVNEAWFREAVTRPHTLQPDALARNPRPLRLVTFEDTYPMRDAVMELELQHLRNSTHGDGILSVYFPRERIYAEVDVWNPGAQIQPHVRSLDEEIRRRGLRIDRIIPMHGNAVQPFVEFQKIVQEWSGRRATTTTFVPPGVQP